MKFEKFLKQVGTHGEVIERNEAEKWLVCDGVGMVIPRGVNNLLGSSRDSEYTSIVNTIANAELDDVLILADAVLLDPSGNASSIYRVFESELGEKVGIINADYGLLEKKDHLGYCEIVIPPTATYENGEEVGEEKTIKYILIFDHTGKIQGFITGSQKF